MGKYKVKINGIELPGEVTVTEVKDGPPEPTRPPDAWAISARVDTPSSIPMAKIKKTYRGSGLVS